MISICIPTLRPGNQLLQQIKDIDNSLLGGDYEIIIQSENQSAALNRNAALQKSKGEYVVMIDDDITRFPKNWAFDLIEPLKKDNYLKVVSARLMTKNLTPGTMISYAGSITQCTDDLWINPNFILPSACIVFSRNTWEAVRTDPTVPRNIPFDVNYKKAVAEDADFIMAVCTTFPGCKTGVYKKVEVVHLNNEVWRTPDFRWEDNHEYFKKKWNRNPF